KDEFNNINELAIKHWESRTYEDMDICCDNFIAGYKAAQSKQFSLEDMKKAIEMAREYEFVQYTNGETKDKYSEAEIIQSLSTQQLPKEFVPTIFYRTSSSGRTITLKEYSGFSEQMKLQCKLYFASNNNSEGKEVLIVTYKY